MLGVLEFCFMTTVGTLHLACEKPEAAAVSVAVCIYLYCCMFFLQFECISDIVVACEKALKYVSDSFMRRLARISLVLCEYSKFPIESSS